MPLLLTGAAQEREPTVTFPNGHSSAGNDMSPNGAKSVKPAKTREDDVLKNCWLEEYRLNTIRAAMEISDRSPKDLEEYAEKFLKLPRRYRPFEGAIRRFSKNQIDRFQSDYQTVGLMLVCLDLLSKRPRLDPDETGVLRDLRTMNWQLCQDLPRPFPGHDYNPDGAVKKSELLLDHLISLMAHEFELKAEDFLAAGSYFFQDFDPEKVPELSLRQHFIMYRFHSTPGKIVKSFTVIASPTQTVGACVFANFFVSPNRLAPRKTTGIIRAEPRGPLFCGRDRWRSGVEIYGSRAVGKFAQTYPWIAYNLRRR